MYLRDIGIQADKSIVSTYKGGFVGNFMSEAGCCIALFLSLIRRKIVTKGTVKIALTFTNDEALVRKKHHMFPEEPDVLIFTWIFPFDKYVESSELEKKHLVFSSMCDCVIYLAKQYKWDTESLENAREQAFSQNYEFTGYSKYSWVSPDSMYRMKIHYEFGLKFIEFYGCLFKNRTKTEISRKFLGRVISGQGPLPLNKSSGKWLSNNKFVLDEPSFWNSKWELSIDEMIEENSL